jgi:Uma2 family endonuclease
MIKLMGPRLGWLIDPDNRQVYVYREDYVVECLETPQTFLANRGCPDSH